jgi:hypothetical protein
MGRKKISEKNYIDIAQRRGFVWVGQNIPQDTHQGPTQWRCGFGHIFTMSYRSVRNDGNCKTCSRKEKLTEECYKNLMNQHNLKWISSILPKNNDTLTEWKCEKNHTVSLSYRRVYMNTSCEICRKECKEDKLKEKLRRIPKKITKSSKDYLILAKTKNLVWSDKVLPRTTNLPSEWTANCGHKKYYSYNALNKNNKGLGCQECLNLTPDRYKEMASLNNIFWIGIELPKNSHTLTPWKCQRGHEWDCQYANIQQGKGCPYCRNKNEEECRDILELIFSKPFPKKKPKWLKIPDARNLELDGYNKDLGLAFEYDGGQHYYPVNFWGGEEYFELIQKRDKAKDIICKENSVQLIRIPYFVTNKKEFIVSELMKLRYHP